MLVTLESWLLGWEPESRYQVNIRIYDDAGGTTSSGWETLSDASHYLELDWQAATGAGANNGSLALYLDGTLERTLSGIDNDTLRVDEVRLGPSAGLDSGTAGTFYLDGFESRRSSYTLAPAAKRSGVGPLAGLLPGGRSHLAALRHPELAKGQGRLLPPESERNPGFFARLSQTMYRALAAAFLPGLSPAYAGVQPAASVLSAPPAGQTWKVYYYAGSQRVALRELTASGGNTLYYLHADHLGSTSLTTCGTATTEGGCDGIALGGAVARQLYLPYGGIRYVTGTMPTDVGFTGQRLDDTGLMHFGARYYSPVVGRFVSADTIVPGASNPQAWNRYSYTVNNPLKYTDPSGHCFILVGLDTLACGVAWLAIAAAGVFYALVPPPPPPYIPPAPAPDPSTTSKVALAAAATAVNAFAQAALQGADEAEDDDDNVEWVDPNELGFSQRTAGGRGRAEELRKSMGERGYDEESPVDVVETPDGLVTIDNTRVAVAQELGIPKITARVHNPADPLPESMEGRFGDAKTWGEALAHRTSNQRPSLPPYGTRQRPTMPGRR